MAEAVSHTGGPRNLFVGTTPVRPRSPSPPAPLPQGRGGTKMDPHSRVPAFTGTFTSSAASSVRVFGPVSFFVSVNPS